MFSWAYFKHLTRSNLKQWSIFTGIICLLIVIILSVFDPKTFEAIRNSSVNLPFNPLGDVSSLISFIANQYFGMMAIIIPMIFSIMLAIRLIAGQVDKGSIACHLALPVSRTQISGTSALYIFMSLAMMFSLIAIVGVVAAEVVQPGELYIKTYLNLTLGAFLLQFAISSITFLASSIWNHAGKAIAIGAGVPIFFFVCNLLSSMSNHLENLKYTTLMTLFDSKAIMEGRGFLLSFAILGLIGIILYLSGMRVFGKKDLPI